MKAKRIPPGWTKTGRNGGGKYAPCLQGNDTTSAEEMQAEISATVEKAVAT